MLFSIKINSLFNNDFISCFNRKDATDILGTAENVVQALDEARIAQEKAEVAIEKANDDILAADNDLLQVTDHIYLVPIVRTTAKLDCCLIALFLKF